MANMKDFIFYILFLDGPVDLSRRGVTASARSVS